MYPPPSPSKRASLTSLHENAQISTRVPIWFPELKGARGELPYETDGDARRLA